MAHHITAQTSVFTDTGNAFESSGPDTSLLVDADAFLITTDITGDGANLSGSWIVTINGAVGSSGDSNGLTISDSSSSTITIGSTGHLFGDIALNLQGAGTIINNGIITRDISSNTGSGYPVDLSLAGNGPFKNTGLIEGGPVDVTGSGIFTLVNSGTMGGIRSGIAT